MDQKEGLRRCACRWHFRRQPLYVATSAGRGSGQL